MEFTLVGFSQNSNIRRFAFKGVAADRTRRMFVVGADLTLISKHSIPLQELPLLCRQLLEGRGDDLSDARLVFAAENMIEYVTRRLEARRKADEKRKPYRRPGGSAVVGQAWR